MMKLVKCESEFNEKLTTKLKTELEIAHVCIRQIKNVLRVPRLYEKFKSLIGEIVDEK